MHTVHYRRWAPQQSRIKVEFPANLLREIRAAVAHDHERGTLFGSLQIPRQTTEASSGLGAGTILEIRALTARHSHEVPRVAGMELVGIYICRARGEVFLTDDDLRYMEQFQTQMALVIAGARAGFFVRQADGTIQTIRSYEEFVVADASAQPDHSRRDPVPPSSTSYSSVSAPSFWKSTLLVMSLLAVPAVALAYLRPLLEERPIRISAQESAEQQLIASWDPSAVPRGGRLEITDAGVRTILSVPPGASSAVYQLRAPSLTGNQGFSSTNVMIRVSAGMRSGSISWSGSEQKSFQPIAFHPTSNDSSRDSGPATLPVHPLTPEADATRIQVEKLEMELKQLRWVAAARSAEIVALGKQAERLITPRQ